jgi:cytochrome P450
MHRDPRYWENPSVFDPTLWIDAERRYNEKNPGQPRGAWFPFGFGARRCVGDRFALMEAAIVLAMLGK